MKITRIEASLLYDGRQLSTPFMDEHLDGAGDGLVLFEGPADVPLEHMVDLEDVEAEAPVLGSHMAHVLVEHRDLALREAVCRQRLLGHLAAGWIAARSGSPVEVQGDDLFVGSGKLSVSVHFAVHVSTEGTPVPTAGLRDLRVPAGEFLTTLARAYADEVASIDHATRKVRAVP
jgi:hypothetical protein